CPRYQASRTCTQRQGGASPRFRSGWSRRRSCRPSRATRCTVPPQRTLATVAISPGGPRALSRSSFLRRPSPLFISLVIRFPLFRLIIKRYLTQVTGIEPPACRRLEVLVTDAASATGSGSMRFDWPAGRDARECFKLADDTAPTGGGGTGPSR